MSSGRARSSPLFPPLFPPRRYSMASMASGPTARPPPDQYDPLGQGQTRRPGFLGRLGGWLGSRDWEGIGAAMRDDPSILAALREYRSQQAMFPFAVRREKLEQGQIERELNAPPEAPGVHVTPSGTFWSDEIDPQTGAPRILGRDPNWQPPAAMIFQPPAGYRGTPEGLEPIQGGPADPNGPMSLRDPLRRAQATADVQRVTDMQAAADRDAATSAQLSRFVALNQREPGTGPGSVGSLLPLLRNSESQQMAAITADLTPEQREPGSGATSNFDATMFMQALPGLDKTPAANRAIASAYRIRAQITAQRAQLARAWLESGSLNGFDAAWSRYVQANPIFDPRSTADEPRLNPVRQDFMSWARQNGIELGTSGREQLGAAPQQAPANNGTAPAQPRERIWNRQTGRFE